MFLRMHSILSCTYISFVSLSKPIIPREIPNLFRYRVSDVTEISENVYSAECLISHGDGLNEFF